MTCRSINTHVKRLAAAPGILAMAFLVAFFGWRASLAATATADLGKEQPGTLLTSFAPAVGAWSAVKDGDRTVLKVDGSGWTRGKPSPELAASARTLYGEQGAAFEKAVSAHAGFPFAVFTGLGGFKQGEVSFRFKSVAGKEDQAAGIIFDLKPNGDALILRGNALEDNLILFQFANGRRTAVKTVEGVPTAKGVWHDIKLVVNGTRIEGFMDGKPYLQHDLGRTVDGRVGVWSKDDSVMLIDGFTVTTHE
ncbi:hypothetical protein [Fundidesulfovibrio terrae]|uniref:hypothetical protein n=1 Tax=Fundidesulfovibrio terrae TaxID=2922866 RepID=UPI001FAFDFA2|nr:hypothetical protein [Fundidesulfovibrio terrae]